MQLRVLVKTVLSEIVKKMRRKKMKCKNEDFKTKKEYGETTTNKQNKKLLSNMAVNLIKVHKIR